MTDIRAGFIYNICEHPNDDVVRLIYADWLEDQEGEIDTARAEYIRVEVELAVVRTQHKAVPQAIWEKLERLHHEEGEDWPTLSESYSPEDYEAIGLSKRLNELLDTDAAKFAGDRWYPPWAKDDYSYYTVDWSRGFILHINIDCADWLKYGSEIVRIHPITSVKLVGREPLDLAPDSSEEDPWHGHFVWGSEALVFPDAEASTQPFSGDLPKELFVHLGGKRIGGNPWTAYYGSREEAEADSSQACVAWARTNAKLPLLEATL